MVYRTLHAYIFRELLRIFLLTAVTLTTLMAFGGLFKPITKFGLDIRQLLVIILNTMPAMLAYAIPVAALFAAVLVYWRMSTDNELTACRAGGISFVAVVMPAFVLGIVVASIDLVFVNYVVPRFLQSTERAVMRDLGSIIVSAIGRQEKFQYGPIVVYADSAELLDSPEPGTSQVRLRGMAGSMVDKNRPSRTVVAREALLTISNTQFEDTVQIEVELDGAAAFDPNAMFRKYLGPVPSITPDGRPFLVPSQLRSKPKFLNWRQLSKLNMDPSSFPTVAETIKRIGDAYTLQTIGQRLRDEALRKPAPSATRPGSVALTLDQSGAGTTAGSQLRLSAGAVTFDTAALPERCLSFYGTPQAPVRVEQWTDGRHRQTFTCDYAVVELSIDRFANTGVGAALELLGNVKRRDEVLKLDNPAGPTLLSGIVLAPRIKDVPLPPATELETIATTSPSPTMQALGVKARDAVQKLFQNIDSERHSRGSFSLSCLTLVLFGAALGILLRGKNPLAVFVVGFVPAVVLVLLITGGRELAEGNRGNVDAGIAMIWAGNVILLGLVVGVYAKLLRH
jgi:lipopolysaccharide export LptBFGC system permease protein LptF